MPSEIRIWINAFIPDSIPGQTVPWPGHAGQSLIVAPGGGAFDTNHRGFSADPEASSKMQSVIVIRGLDSGHPVAERYHRSSTTHEVDPHTGAVTGAATATSPGLVVDDPVHGLVIRQLSHGPADRGFDPPHWTAVAADPVAGVHDLPGSGAGDQVIAVDVHGSRHDPLVPVAPSVDYAGTFVINLTQNTVSFHGEVDHFPDFESYYQADGGRIHTLFRVHADVPDVLGLVGGPSRHIEATTRIGHDNPDSSVVHGDADASADSHDNGTTGRTPAHDTAGPVHAGHAAAAGGGSAAVAHPAPGQAAGLSPAHHDQRTGDDMTTWHGTVTVWGRDEHDHWRHETFTEVRNASGHPLGTFRSHDGHNDLAGHRHAVAQDGNGHWHFVHLRTDHDSNAIHIEDASTARFGANPHPHVPGPDEHPPQSAVDHVNHAIHVDRAPHSPISHLPNHVDPDHGGGGVPGGVHPGTFHLMSSGTDLSHLPEHVDPHTDHTTYGESVDDHNGGSHASYDASDEHGADSGNHR